MKNLKSKLYFGILATITFIVISSCSKDEEAIQ